MKSMHRLTLERYEKYGEGYNPSINYEDKVLKFVGYGRKQTTRPTERMAKFGLPYIYVHVCQSVCLVCACVLVGLSCVSVGLPCVCMCIISRSALCVHVYHQSICLVCTCVSSVGLPFVYMCVSRSALYVHVYHQSICLVCTCVSSVDLPCVHMCIISRSAFCVHVCQ